ncbi:LLM class flavin-dependent oxidoreductase [Herbiconiux moechotypicola]|uniref:5,10-methylenetetrahydromethanopterin reductase n=1 Tax=Herbiconiux moechotypicola TaxID=637393 RepID=A0ABN3E0M4_9MICO|nr:LLM class flavin-dependent oxidoreductase [Herbiconiux moechotypicola]MCS5731123.1 LLM class flavin-dependent oxidoreductase [Herbiconiux moechotypicola]
MTRPVTFSARIGSASAGVEALADRALLAEESGFDQVWTGNDLFGHSGLVGLAAIAMRTTRIRFGSGVMDPVSLHPAQIASYASALQELSGDRFLLGLGAGSDVFFSWAGLTPPPPVVRTRQAVLAIRELLAGRSPMGVPGVADGWTEQAVLHDPRPTPIYVGAMGPKMIAMTGRIADGALSLCLPPRHVFGVIDQLKAGAESAGRSIDDLDVAACVWVSISDDRDEARALLAKHIALYSGSLSTAALEANGLDPEEFARTQALMSEGREADAVASVTDSMLELGIVGEAAEVIDQCGALIAAGARHISFGPPMGPDPAAALRLLGSQVLPRLREQF